MKHIFHTVHDVFWSSRYAIEWVLFIFESWYISCEGMQAPLCFHCCCSICVCMSSLSWDLFLEILENTRAEVCGIFLFLMYGLIPWVSTEWVFFFPTWVLSDFVRKGKHLCVSSAAAACVCAAWAFCKGLIPSHNPWLCIDDWLGKWVVHFLCFECQAGPCYSFSPISLSKIQIQIQSLVLEASGE